MDKNSLSEFNERSMMSWRSLMRRYNVRDTIPTTITNIELDMIAKMVQTRTSVEMVIAEAQNA